MIKLLPKRWRQRVLAATAVGTTLLVWPSALAQGVGPHVSGGVMAGNAAGLEDGYVHFGGFVPLVQPDEQSLLFLDGSLLLMNEGSDYLGGNLGAGLRSYSYTTDTILGGYVYYDRRDLDLYEFDQIGLGLESLGRNFDARLNVCVPVGNTRKGVDTGGVVFSGSEIGSVVRQFSALTTVDGEVGALLVTKESVDYRGFVGVYGLFHGEIDNTAGVRGRVEARIADQCFVGGYIEHDGEFDTTGGFTFEYRFGAGRSKANRVNHNLLARLGDPIQRRRHIAIAERNETVTLTTGGTAVQFTHVGGTASIAPTAVGLSSTGDGTAENPYTSPAEIATSNADIVWVHGGTYDNEAITVNLEGQTLWGGSQQHTLSTDQGDYLIAGTGPVILRNNSVAAITVAANDVTISGFTIEDGATNSHGIYGDSVNGLVVKGNTFSNLSGAGIYLEGSVSGQIESNTFTDVILAFSSLSDFTGDVTNNHITNATVTAVQTIGALVGDVSGNTITDSGAGIFAFGGITGSISDNEVSNGTGIGIGVSGTLDGDLTNNLVTDAGTTGIEVTGDITGTASGNEVLRSAGYRGIDVTGRIEGDLSNNLSSNNLNDGFYVGGGVAGSVTGNTASDNGDDGFDLAGTVGAGVSNNVAYDNIGHGFALFDNITGDLASNTALRNGDFGIELRGDVTGSITSNQTNSNVRSGIYSSHGVGGDVSGNTSNDNGSPTNLVWAGLYFQDAVTGDIKDNITNDNYGKGIFFVGGAGGDVANNTANNNGTLSTDSGLVSNNGVGGDMTGNVTNSNAGTGVLVFGSVTGDVTGNTANNNGNNGIAVSGTIGGAQTPNTTTGNGSTGFVN